MITVADAPAACEVQDMPADCLSQLLSSTVVASNPACYGPCRGLDPSWPPPLTTGLATSKTGQGTEIIIPCDSPFLHLSFVSTSQPA